MAVLSTPKSPPSESIVSPSRLVQEIPKAPREAKSFLLEEGESWMALELCSCLIPDFEPVSDGSDHFSLKPKWQLQPRKRRRMLKESKQIVFQPILLNEENEGDSLTSKPFESQTKIARPEPTARASPTTTIAMGEH